MSFFQKILSKLGIGSAQATTADTTDVAVPAAGAPRSDDAQGAPAPAVTATAPSGTMPVVDVVAQLEEKAAASSQKLNWRTSIVDLLKLLDMDSSLTARKDLATELGCPADLLSDSAQMNMWLHKEVLARIAANGGNVPQELLS